MASLQLWLLWPRIRIKHRIESKPCRPCSKSCFFFFPWSYDLLFCIYSMAVCFCHLMATSEWINRGIKRVFKWLNVVRIKSTEKILPVLGFARNIVIPFQNATFSHNCLGKLSFSLRSFPIQVLRLLSEALILTQFTEHLVIPYGLEQLEALAAFHP